MTQFRIATTRLDLLLETVEAARHRLAELPPEVLQMISQDWLRMFEAAGVSSPWIHGFVIIERDSHSAIGQCGFKGPPDENGMVEIAYAVEPQWQGRGYATEAAEALTRFALEQDEVNEVRAHTMPEPNASTHVLTKCHFRQVGEVIDPDDGPVWRWQRLRDEA